MWVAHMEWNFDESLRLIYNIITCKSISEDIEACNKTKFRATVMTPNNQESMSRRRGRRKGFTRIHINGMTCNKCVNYIQTKVSKINLHPSIEFIIILTSVSLFLGW